MATTSDSNTLSRHDLLVTRSLNTEPLVIGPMLRRVDQTSATIWVETSVAGQVTVTGANRSWTAPTFSAHGSHYAVVLVDGLEPGSSFEYAVTINDAHVWPLRDVDLPPSRITTIDPERATRLAFGSCRTSDPHDADGHANSGVDAMRAMAIELTDADPSEFPDLMVLLGDQVYADETPEAMREFIESRRSVDEPPGTELADYVEHAHLYDLAWSEPFNRWLLSTIPSVMIFDDHDVRDDWNTSQAWREEMESLPWWKARIVGALASYWVYQHAGNLSHDDLREDRIYRQVLEHAASEKTDELDLTDELDALAAEVDQHPDAYRWSYTLELGDSRLVMIDSRAARVLTPGARQMLTSSEERWLEEQMRGDVDHLFVGTSLPFLLIPGLHNAEALTEAMTNYKWGTRVADLGERVRQTFDLEHWAAFQHGFRHLFEQAAQVVSGARGRTPYTVTFLSGDVHNSYVAEVPAGEIPGATGRIVQAVCSPIRNPMPKGMRWLMANVAGRLKKPLDLFIGLSSKMAKTPWSWSVTHGPWFDNNIAILDVDGERLQFVWLAGEVVDKHTQRPDLRAVAKFELPRD